MIAVTLTDIFNSAVTLHVIDFACCLAASFGLGAFCMLLWKK